MAAAPHSHSHTHSSTPPPSTSTNNGTPFPSPPTHDSCNDTYETHDHDDDTLSRMRMASSSKIAGRAIAPFLARHIPAAYAPTGAAREGEGADRAKDPSTKFCYRHRPDLKCRRTADEPSMDHLQRVSACRLWGGGGGGGGGCVKFL